MGACDQKNTESILDFFYEQGGMLSPSQSHRDWTSASSDRTLGNFIDTANNYQFEESEMYVFCLFYHNRALRLKSGAAGSASG